jgi:hypothetical protein
MKKFLLIFIIALISCNSQTENAGRTNNRTIQYNEFISNLKLPDTMTFCGERVPLEIPEVKERAERELYLLIDDPGRLCFILNGAADGFRFMKEYSKKRICLMI